MSKVALVQFALAATMDNVERVGPERDIYDRCRLWPHARVFIDHDHDQDIGYVRELTRFDDAYGLWHMALIHIDEPPSWLKKNTPVSMAGNTLSRGTMLGREITRDMLLKEISLVSPALEPAEPQAKVLTLREAPDPFAPPKISELPPLNERTALLHYDAAVAIGCDPDATLLDIKRKLAMQKHDPRLGRRTNIHGPGRASGPVQRGTLVRDCGTILGIS